MSSSAPSRAQLFFDAGARFNEADSRTSVVSSNSLFSFEKLTFDLPHVDIRHLRFDPLTTAGTVAIKQVVLKHDDRVIVQFSPDDILPLNQIASRTVENGAVEFTTIPRSNDPSLTLQLGSPLRLKRLARLEELRLLLIYNAVFLALAALVWTFRRQLARFIAPPTREIQHLDARVEEVARRLSAPGFIEFHSGALWFYLFCLICFFAAGLADLNGSSIGLFSSEYGHGAKAALLLGTPQELRSDEWGYLTPVILNQALRVQRFEAENSAIGRYSVALMGNIPIRHISTIFRPQFWAFWVLPVDYAFSFYWQFKALLLITGVFTWLLLITQSTFWSATGSLWYFFSPFTQWTYSWASGLAEMVGLICLTIVFACYLTIGTNRLALILASLGTAGCAINFALCAYVPHTVPLAWLAIFFFSAWCIAARERIFTRESAGLRWGAALLAIALIAAIGADVYLDLRTAIAGIAHTTFPGQRVFGGGSLPRWQLPSNFFQWFEDGKRFPRALNNICEGSGFLWLAPATWLIYRRIVLRPYQRYLLGTLWVVSLLILAWLLLPVPANVGKLFGFDRTYGPRCLPALGLANTAIVAVCLASFRNSATPDSVTRVNSPRRQLITFFLAVAAGFGFFALLLYTANRHLDHYFSRGMVLWSAAIAAAFAALLITGRARILAAALVLSQAILFGTVNPVERGLGVFTSSELYRFVHSQPQLMRGKWIVYSGSVVASGFFEAVGCEVYTGERYLPDVDHFPLFASRGLNLNVFNRLGFLVAFPQPPEAATRFATNGSAIVEWYIAPSDPLLQQLGIEYAAFDQPPPAALTTKLTALSDAPVDGFWLYRLP